MLSDEEILDDKTQSLDTALQELEAQRDDVDAGPVNATVRDVLKDQQLTIAVECIEQLTDLYHTISQEGVSAYDVQALRAIQSRMTEISVLGGNTRVALENYEGLFTPTRSPLNQTVSQEAILVEFGRIIKEWFLKLVDFCMDVVKWVKNVKDSEIVINLRTRNMNDELTNAKLHLSNMRNLNINSDRKLKLAYDEIQDAVLADPKLPKCRLTLMGFGPGPLNTEFDRYLKSVLTYGKIFATVTEDLLTILEGGNFANANATFIGSIVEDAVKEIEDFAVESSDNDYFSKELPNLDMYNPKYVIQRKVYYIEPFNNLLKGAVSDLRRIKRFDKVNLQQAEVDRIAAAVKDLTLGIKALERVIQTISKLNNCYFKVTASYLNYYIRCFEYTREDFTANVLSDLQRAAFDKIAKAWDSMIDKLGIM